MFETLGKRAAVIPLGLALALGCLFSVMFYPMAHMEMKNLPFALVSLDEGVETSEGSVNLGSIVADNMESGTLSDDAEESPIVWTRFDSPEALDEALASGDYYGAIVVPRDFSARQYQTLVDTMQEQIGKMQSEASSALSGGSSPLAGLSALSTATSAAPQLSVKAVKGIEAAQKLAQGAQVQAGAAAKAQAALQAKADEAASALDEAQKAQAAILAARDEAKERLDAAFSGSGEEGSGAVSVEELQKAYDELCEQYEQAQAATASLGQSAEQITALLAQAQGNSASAQANAKTAAVNAASSKSTATAAATLQAKASALASSLTTLKSALGNASAGMSDEKVAEIAETASAKALVAAADEMAQGAASADEDSDGAAAITVYIDKAKSPLVASNLKSSMKALFAEAGVTVDIVTLHDDAADDEQASASPMAAILGIQVGVMPLVILSLIGGILITRIFARIGATPRERLRPVAIQLVYAAAFSLVVAALSCAMVVFIGGMDVPWDATVPFLWVASFALMTISTALADVKTPLAALFAICVIALGMATTALPFEALPAFYQDWVYPWAPQRFLGEGLRSILYLGAGAWDAGGVVFAPAALIGVAFLAITALIPETKSASE